MPDSILWDRNVALRGGDRQKSLLPLMLFYLKSLTLENPEIGCSWFLCVILFTVSSWVSQIQEVLNAVLIDFEWLQVKDGLSDL